MKDAQVLAIITTISLGLEYLETALCDAIQDKPYSEERAKMYTVDYFEKTSAKLLDSCYEATGETREED